MGDAAARQLPPAFHPNRVALAGMGLFMSFHSSAQGFFLSLSCSLRSLSKPLFLVVAWNLCEGLLSIFLFSLLYNTNVHNILYFVNGGVGYQFINKFIDAHVDAEFTQQQCVVITRT